MREDLWTEYLLWLNYQQYLVVYWWWDEQPIMHGNTHVPARQGQLLHGSPARLATACTGQTHRRNMAGGRGTVVSLDMDTAQDTQPTLPAWTGICYCKCSLHFSICSLCTAFPTLTKVLQGDGEQMTDCPAHSWLESMSLFVIVMTHPSLRPPDRNIAWCQQCEGSGLCVESNSPEPGTTSRIE